MATEVFSRKFQDDWPASFIALRDALAKLSQIETVALRHNNSSVVTSTHILASKILEIIRTPAEV